MNLYTLGLEDAINEPHEYDPDLIQFDEYVNGFATGELEFDKIYQAEAILDSEDE